MKHIYLHEYGCLKILYENLSWFPTFVCILNRIRFLFSMVTIFNYIIFTLLLLFTSHNALLGAFDAKDPYTTVSRSCFSALFHVDYTHNFVKSHKSILRSSTVVYVFLCLCCLPVYTLNNYIQTMPDHCILIFNWFTQLVHIIYSWCNSCSRGLNWNLAVRFNPWGHIEKTRGVPLIDIMVCLWWLHSKSNPGCLLNFFYFDEESSAFDHVSLCRHTTKLIEPLYHCRLLSCLWFPEVFLRPDLPTENFWFDRHLILVSCLRKYRTRRSCQSIVRVEDLFSFRRNIKHALHAQPRHYTSFIFNIDSIRIDHPLIANSIPHFSPNG